MIPLILSLLLVFVVIFFAVKIIDLTLTDPTLNQVAKVLIFILAIVVVLNTFNVHI